MLPLCIIQNQSNTQTNPWYVSFSDRSWSKVENDFLSWTMILFLDNADVVVQMHLYLARAFHFPSGRYPQELISSETI